MEATRENNILLHKSGPCHLCRGCDLESDFDYCRACGFTVLDIPKESLDARESSLAKAVKIARGGEPPTKFNGM